MCNCSSKPIEKNLKISSKSNKLKSFIQGYPKWNLDNMKNKSSLLIVNDNIKKSISIGGTQWKNNQVD